MEWIFCFRQEVKIVFIKLLVCYWHASNNSHDIISAVIFKAKPSVDFACVWLLHYITDVWFHLLSLQFGNVYPGEQIQSVLPPASSSHFPLPLHVCSLHAVSSKDRNHTKLICI